MAISRMNFSTLIRNISFIMDLSSLRTDCQRTLKVKVLIHSTHLNKCFQPFIILFYNLKAIFIILQTGECKFREMGMGGGGWGDTF